MIKNIPLSTLRVFEATARIGSFIGAADELHLSASAVSHAITKLERTLGTPLYKRTTRSIKLTQAGQLLSIHITRAFEDIRLGLLQVANNQPTLLRIHCAPTFAARVLTPVISVFMTQHPNIEVSITANTNYARFSDDIYDVDIVYGEIPMHDEIIAIPLGREDIVPLCNADIAKTIKKPEDILNHKLILSTNKRLGWADWCAKYSFDNLSQPYMSFDRSFLAIDAATHGLGIVLECTRFAATELKDGRLVCPIDADAYGLNDNGHYFAYPKSSNKRNLIRKFANWLMSQI